MVLEGVSGLLQQALAAVLPDNPLMQLVIQNALLVLTLLAILFVLFVLLLALFLDFVTDIWKIPFAVGVDVLKYFGLFNPWWALVAGGAGALIFILFSDVQVGKWLFAAISLATGVLTFFWGGLVIGVLIAIIPVNTIMMFLATIID